MKGFWQKYPSPEFDFVKFNNVIDMQLISDNCLTVRRLMYTRIQKFMWAYAIEDIRLYFDDRLMEMKTELVKKSSLFPPVNNGVEKIIYRAFGDTPHYTQYLKTLENESSSFVKKYLDKINNSFTKGCRIVEDKCKSIMN